mmetsp:Transcript_16821/g.19072  ORF Transcript_16821/g.19072 Transcript_16821/m.19072 type:complete len:82 (+) Transcript_16821:182-427(+)
MLTIGSLLKALLLVVNAAAVLDEKRFLSHYGLAEIDVDGISSGKLKAQVAEALRLCRLMRVPLIALNTLSIFFDVVSMVLS